MAGRWRMALGLSAVLLTTTACAVAGPAGISSPQTSSSAGVLTASGGQKSLTDTTWLLDGIIHSGVVASPPAGISASLRIAAGRIHYFDGVNDSDGPVEPGGRLVVGSDTVQIHGGVGTSATGCVSVSGHACFVDMSVLSQDFHYRISGDHLVVTGTGRTSGEGLTFIASHNPSDGNTGSAALNSADSVTTVPATPTTRS